MQPAWARALRYGFVNQTLYAEEWQAIRASEHLFAAAEPKVLQTALCQTEAVAELNPARMTALALAFKSRGDLLWPAFRESVLTLDQFLLFARTLKHLQIAPTNQLRSFMNAWLAHHLTARDAQYERATLAPLLHELRPQIAEWGDEPHAAAAYLLGQRAALPRQIAHQRMTERFRAGRCEAADLDAIRRHQFGVAEVRRLVYDLTPEDQEAALLTSLPFSMPDELPPLVALMGDTPSPRLAAALAKNFFWLDTFQRATLGPWAAALPARQLSPAEMPQLRVFVSSAYAMTPHVLETNRLLRALSEELTWAGLYDLTPDRPQTDESLAFPLAEGALAETVRPGDQVFVLTSGYDVPSLERELRSLPQDTLRVVWHAGGQRDVAPRFGGIYFAYGPAPAVAPVLSHFLTEHEGRA